MVWLVGVICSVVGAAIFATALALIQRQRLRRGVLAGWWWQVTYPSGATHRGGEPWSVELVNVKNSSNQIRATAWRVFKAYYERRWISAGRTDDDSAIDLLYWADRGEGGHGSIHMWRVTKNEYFGKYVEAVLDGTEMAVKFRDAPIAWLRLGAECAREIDDLVRATPPPNTHLPVVAAQILDPILGRQTKIKRWHRALAYSGAYSNPLPALTLEAEALREAERDPLRREIKLKQEEAGQPELTSNSESAVPKSEAGEEKKRSAESQ